MLRLRSSDPGHLSRFCFRLWGAHSLPIPLYATSGAGLGNSMISRHVSISREGSGNNNNVIKNACVSRKFPGKKTIKLDFQSKYWSKRAEFLFVGFFKATSQFEGWKRNFEKKLFELPTLTPRL